MQLKLEGRRPLTDKNFVEKTQGNKLCVISLVLFLFTVLIYIPLWLLPKLLDLNSLLQAQGLSNAENVNIALLVSNFASAIYSTSFLGAVTLMIITRVKFPQNRFGLILMIIYILSLVAVIMYYVVGVCIIIFGIIRVIIEGIKPFFT